MPAEQIGCPSKTPDSFASIPTPHRNVECKHYIFAFANMPAIAISTCRRPAHIKCPRLCRRCQPPRRAVDTEPPNKPSRTTVWTRFPADSRTSHGKTAPEPPRMNTTAKPLPATSAARSIASIATQQKSTTIGFRRFIVIGFRRFIIRGIMSVNGAMPATIICRIWFSSAGWAAWRGPACYGGGFLLGGD